MRNKDWNLIVQEANENYATKVTVSGDYTYVAIAKLGCLQASSLWQVKRIDTSVAGTTVITWADGDDAFDNSAVDLTALDYS